MKITAIIPLRVTPHVYQARERLERIIDTIPDDLYDILIVDYGTPKSERQALEQLEGGNVKILRYESSGEIFSIGHARDLGTQYAETDVVFFHDIDFYGSTLMYQNIHDEVVARNMAQCAYDFFCIPVFFLTEYGSNLFLSELNESQNQKAFNNQFHSLLFQGRPGILDFAAYGSSAIVVNRHHYLAIGGHSREFYGHGAEDYDVLHRLAAYYPKGPRTADYYIDTKSNAVSEYKGFRAYFALYGIDVFARGIYFAHLWHPKRQIPGYHQSSRNFSLLTDLMNRFDKWRDQPLALGDMTLRRKSLVLMKSDSAALKAVRQVLPYLGDYEVIDENSFRDAENFIEYLKDNNISHVLLPNPYGNQYRLAFYEAMRKEGIPCYVYDRGALPDSWFFDLNGFNADSISYREEKWNRELSEEERSKTLEYIFNLKNGEATLEENGSRKSGRYLREKLGLGRKKVLFVPFQRPSDTVTNHFAGPAESVSGFHEWVRFLQNNLPKSEWVIICKNHPLEPDEKKIEDVIYAGRDVHVHDLLDLSEKVFLMNSGVGVLALAFGKPVICAGTSFYVEPGLAYSAKTPDEALQLIKSKIRPDEEKVLRFFNYLAHEFYSFGKTTYRKTVAKDGSNRTIAYDIVFEKLRVEGIVKKDIHNAPKGASLDAPLFSSFGGRDKVKATLSKKANSPTSTSPAPLKSSPTLSSDKIKIIHQPSQFQRKLAKFMHHPKLFFADMIKKRTK